MAHTRVMRDWKPLRFFPWIETRKLRAFLDTNPNVPLDLVPPWTEWRFRRRALSEGDRHE